MKRFILAASAAILLSASATAAQQEPVMVSMKANDGSDRGYITLQEGHNGVVIEAMLEGIPAGWHGFHIHEVGSCADAFKAAKGHYNPEGASHGVNHGHKRHAGDLPNLHAFENGQVRANVITSLVTLAAGPTTLNDADGSSFIIHEKADSYGEKAGAGGRIACGVISSGN